MHDISRCLLRLLARKISLENLYSLMPARVTCSTDQLSFLSHTHKIIPATRKTQKLFPPLFFGVDGATFERELSENEKLSAIIFLLMCCKHVQLLVIRRSVLTARVRRHMPRQITHSGIVVRCFVAVSLYRLICPTGCLRYAHTKRNRNRQNHKIKQRRERNLIASGGFHASFFYDRPNVLGNGRIDLI